MQFRSMISYTTYDIFLISSGIIFHSCNNRGAMGKGFAKQVRDIFPKTYARYKCECRLHKLALGDVIWSIEGDGIVIANLIGQNGYGDDGLKRVSYEAIKKGFTETCIVAKETKTNIHMPKIGSGLGGGNWQTIEIIIKTISDAHEVHVFIHVFHS